MANIRINTSKREIVITKAFAKKAEQFRSDEYNELRDAKLENPNFKVVVKKSSKKETHKGLTFEFMSKYIEKHDENGLLKEEFDAITKNEDGIQSMSYGEVKEWFLVSFPEVDEIYKRREEISNRVKAKKAELKKVA